MIVNRSTTAKTCLHAMTNLCIMWIMMLFLYHIIHLRPSLNYHQMSCYDEPSQKLIITNPQTSAKKNVPSVNNVPYRLKLNVRKECIQSLKCLLDELYIIASALAMSNDIIVYTRKNHPTKNGISLIDKYLSRKKNKRTNKKETKTITQVGN